MQHYLLVLFFFVCQTINPESVTQPLQKTVGPGGAEYLHQAVTQYDFAKKADGYWLFVPESPMPKTANVVVFMHGYGAYNTMIYGNFIKHIVQKGNIVIYPRYQKNLFVPKPEKFTKNAAQGIKDALEELKKDKYPTPITDNMSYVCHSYGGVISTNLGVNFEQYDIPQPKAMMLCSPGSGPFDGGRLESYEQLPPDLKLLIMVTDHDEVVGSEFAELVYQTATNTPNRNLIWQYADPYGNPNISAGHNECYSLNEEFDTGVRNITAKRALRISKLDALDYNGYWKLFDALNNCTRNGKNCDIAMGNTPAQLDLGKWSDGTEIRPYKVRVPTK